MFEGCGARFTVEQEWDSEQNRVEFKFDFFFFLLLVNFEGVFVF